MRLRDALLVTAAAVLVGWALVVRWGAVARPGDVVAYDVYQYYLPNVFYLLQRLAAGGSGLLWNPFQNCGEPAFGISSTGMLYPANLVFLVLQPDVALRAVLVLNFTIAGVGMYALGREIGMSRAGAFCGAIAFEMGTATVDLSTWGPQMGAPWVWLPAMMYGCERILRRPSFAAVVGLGAAIAVALLPGFPQTVVFTYQLIALRLLFEVAMRYRERALRWRPIGLVCAGLTLGALFAAFPLLPGMEMARLSVRGHALTTAELHGGFFYDWDHLMRMLAVRWDIFNPFVLIPCVVAGAAWLRPLTRPMALFYLLAGAVYFTLAFAEATPLFAIYRRLPFGTMFREPSRFTWMTSFCLAVLAGLGADAILSREVTASRPRRWLAVGATALALIAVYWLSPNHLRPLEWGLGLAVVGGSALLLVDPRWRRLAAVFVVGAPILNLLAYRTPVLATVAPWTTMRSFPVRQLLPDLSPYAAYSGFVASVAAQMTANDRIYFVSEHPSFTLMPKLASLLQIPAIQDYEPQPTARSAAFAVALRLGRDMTSLNEYYTPVLQEFPPAFPKPLLDLAAARYVFVAQPVDNSARAVWPPLYPLAMSDDGHVVAYENRQALPRAFYVPRAQVFTDPLTMLHRLRARDHDPRALVLLEQFPPSGFLGEVEPPADSRAAAVEFLVDEPERVVLRVQAPARGFLHLADQYFPGWRATVDGNPTPILPANYLFRAVEVPAGESTVEFRYAPASVRIGAAISAASILGVIGVALWRWRTRRVTA